MRAREGKRQRPKETAGTVISCDNNTNLALFLPYPPYHFSVDLYLKLQIFLGQFASTQHIWYLARNYKLMPPTLVSVLGRVLGGWESRGTVAAETDAVETFKMHAPLMGTRADCEREGE